MSRSNGPRRTTGSGAAYPEPVTAFLIALLPSVGVLLIFWVGIRALVQADRRERAAQARIEAAERLRNPAATPSRADSPTAGAGPDVNPELD